ncbi:peptidyl-tRNA hydrolase [Thiomonas sp.]
MPSAYSIPYVYVVVRRDLPLHHQITQACHAALELGFDEERPGHHPVHLITLSVADEPELLQLEQRLTRSDIRFHLFWEPDPVSVGETRPMGATALATEPLQGSRRQPLARLCLWRHAPLAKPWGPPVGQVGSPGS